jgi:DNA sulfur modification protein DndE
MTPEGLAPVMSASYMSSVEGERILRRLTRDAGFSTENIIARLAISRSLAEGQLPDSEPWSADRGGKQIRGFTLLGRQEIASSLVAMIIEAERRPVSTDELKQLVRDRWEHGLRLLDRESRGSDPETMLLEYSKRALLTDRASADRRALSPRSVLDGAIVGQTPLKTMLSRLVDEGLTFDPVRLRRPVLLLGAPGTGRTTIAGALAKSMQLPFVDIEHEHLESSADALRRVEWLLADQGYARSQVKAGRFDYPPMLVHVDWADTPGFAVIISALQPRRQFTDVGEMAVRVTGGGVVVAASRPVIGPFERLEVAPYARDEVAEILRRQLGQWPLEIRKLIVLAGRFNPGLALAKLQETLDIAKVRGKGGRPSENLLLGIMEADWGMDRLGLTRADYDYLTEIEAVRPGAGGGDPEFLERLGLIRVRDGEVTITNRGTEILALGGDS